MTSRKSNFIARGSRPVFTTSDERNLEMTSSRDMFHVDSSCRNESGPARVAKTKNIPYYTHQKQYLTDDELFSMSHSVYCNSTNIQFMDASRNDLNQRHGKFVGHGWVR